MGSDRPPGRSRTSVLEAFLRLSAVPGRAMSPAMARLGRVVALVAFVALALTATLAGVSAAKPSGGESEVKDQAPTKGKHPRYRTGIAERVAVSPGKRKRKPGK